ncbi:OTU-domain-containing protein [Hypoxylon sp. FL1150]|nr:OTU-domain-containing protein [Hypoxylon sp. FL1150]
MQIRYKAPQGAGKVELHDTATVSQLLDALKTKTGLADVTVKYGWPPKALGTHQYDTSLQELGLQRESLTIAPAANAFADATTSAASIPAAERSGEASQKTTDQKESPLCNPQSTATAQDNMGIKDQNISVSMPETGSTLVLRIMPDDNSCMFTAVGGALRGLPSAADNDYSAPELRRIVVSHIEANPEKYSEAILGKPSVAYCRNILQPDTWGGEIELAILSEIFSIEIDVIDVKTNTVYRIGEGNGYAMRCAVVYSNIHYDRLAEVFFEGQEEMDFDVTRWAVDGSDHIITNAKELCRILRDKHHYYTSTSDFVVRCDICQWIGQGQESVVRHVSQTGHQSITEIRDNP